MTAPRPITHQRLASLLERRGIAYDETLLAEIVECCKRASAAPRAVQIYQEYAEATPPKAFWESMEANIKDFDLWERVVSGYVANGWNKLNLSNIFEFYNRGEVPAARTSANRSAQPRSLAAVTEFLQESGAFNG